MDVSLNFDGMIGNIALAYRSGFVWYIPVIFVRLSQQYSGIKKSPIIGRMNYKATTMIPNSILDTYLPELSGAELKILLIIIRQTIGWIDAKGHRKQKDWITQKFFVKKTGLSRKTVALAVQSLIMKKLIITSHNEGVKIPHSNNSMRTYYSLHSQLWSKNDTSREKKVLPTKLTVHKTKPEPRRLTDRERLLEILQLGDQYSKGSLSTAENLESPKAFRNSSIG